MVCGGNSRFFTLLKKDCGYFHQCSSCGLIWLAKAEQPANDQMHYDEEYYAEEFSGRKNTNEAFSNRLPFIEKFVVRPSKVLEIGAAAGDFLNVLEQRGHRVAGVELSARAVREAEEKYNYKFFHGDLLGAQFPKEEFDVVMMYHVLEHVPNPQTLLAEIRRVLKKGGVLIIEVPHPTGIDSIFSKKLRKNIFDYPHHRFAFPPRTLRKIIGEANLNIRCLEASPSFLIMNLIKRVKNIFRRKKTVSTNASGEGRGEGKKISSLHLRYPRLYKYVGRVLPGMRLTIVAIKHES